MSIKQQPQNALYQIWYKPTTIPEGAFGDWQLYTTAENASEAFLAIIKARGFGEAFATRTVEFEVGLAQ